MSTNYQQTTSPTLDHPEIEHFGIVDYLKALLDQRWLIIAVTIIVTAAVMVATYFMTPTYRATSTIQIERDPINVIDVGNLIPAESPLDRDFYQTQYQLLQSRSLAQAVVKAARLDSDPVFKSLMDKEFSRAGIDLSQQHGESSDPALGEMLAPILLNGLHIEPILNSRLVYINYDASNPVLAAKIANTYAQVFIEKNQQRRSDAANFATRVLAERLEQLRTRVEESERNLVAYLGQEKIATIGGDRPSLPEQNLVELNGTLASVQAERIKAESAWLQARNSDEKTLPQAIMSPLLHTLEEDRAHLLNDFRQKSSIYKPDYPEMQLLQGQINENALAINREVINIRESLKVQYDGAVQQEHAINQHIDELKNDVLDFQKRSFRYNLLKREVDTNHQLYDAVLQRYKEINVTSNISNNNILVVDRADTPNQPIAPKRNLNIALGVVFGLFLGVVFALLRYFIRVERRVTPRQQWSS